MQRIIKVKDKNLLMNSDIAKKYPILMNFLEEKADFPLKDFNTLDDETQNFFKVQYPKILEIAKREWDTVGTGVKYSADKKKCQLCNRSTRNVVPIKNNINGKQLVVGPVCSEEFRRNKMNAS